MKRMHKYVVLLVLQSIALVTAGQDRSAALSLDEIIEMAMQKNLGLQVKSLQIERLKAKQGMSQDVAKTEFFYGFDQNNIAENGKPLHIIGVGQQFKFPKIYQLQSQLNEASVVTHEKSLNTSQHHLQWQIKQAYQKIIYQQEKINYLTILDSLVEKFQESTSRLLELGEGDYLQKISADAKRNRSQLQLRQSRAELASAYQELYQWVQSEEPFTIETIPIERLEILNMAIEVHPKVAHSKQKIQLAERELQLANKLHLPAFNVSLFQGFNSFDDLKIYPGFELGLALPIWKKQFAAQRQAGEINRQMAAVELEEVKRLLTANYDILENELQKHLLAINQFEEKDKQLVNELFDTADKFFQGGEIDVLQYLQIIEQATHIQMEYLKNIHLYNQTVLQMNYLIL